MLQRVILTTPSPPEVMQVERGSWTAPWTVASFLPSFNLHVSGDNPLKLISFFLSLPPPEVGHSVRDRWPVRYSNFSLRLTFLSYVSDLYTGHPISGSHVKPRWLLVCVFIGCVLGNTNLELTVITRVELSSLIMLHLFIVGGGGRGSTVSKVLCYISEGRWFYPS